MKNVLYINDLAFLPTPDKADYVVYKGKTLKFSGYADTGEPVWEETDELDKKKTVTLKKWLRNISNGENLLVKVLMIHLKSLWNVFIFSTKWTN
jgi:hypothetical protein